MPEWNAECDIKAYNFTADLKIESCHDVNAVVVSGTGACHHNLRCHQWQQSLHHSRLLVGLLWQWTIMVMLTATLKEKTNIARWWPRKTCTGKTQCNVNLVKIILPNKLIKMHSSSYLDNPFLSNALTRCYIATGHSLITKTVLTVG